MVAITNSINIARISVENLFIIMITNNSTLTGALESMSEEKSPLRKGSTYGIGIT